MIRSKTIIATPPGATIKEQLDDIGMTQKEFAARMNLSEKHISRLINGEVQLTPEVSMKLETVLGIPSSFWNNLEATYREKLIRIDEENSAKADEEIARRLPYAELAALGWVAAARDIREKVINLRNFFGVVDLSLLENAQISRVACRRLAVTEKSDLALLAWIQKAKLIAREADTEPINTKKLSDILPQIRSMTRQAPEEFVPTLKHLLASCGIALVLIPHLKGSFLQGATFMDGNKYVIGMTARGSDADKFWFSLFHELGHITLGHVGKGGGTTKEDETAANKWAEEALIPKKDFDFISRRMLFSEREICKVSENMDIAPGIIVGRLQNSGLIRHSELNRLKEHYRM